jgi:hypothetical protein
MGNIPSHIRAKAAEKDHVQARGRHAIDIVVAIETDPLSGLNGSMQPIDGLFDVRNQKRIMRRALMGTQPMFGLGFGGDTSSQQD